MIFEHRVLRTDNLFLTFIEMWIQYLSQHVLHNLNIGNKKPIKVFLYGLRRFKFRKNIFYNTLYVWRKTLSLWKTFTIRFWGHASKHSPTLFCNLDYLTCRETSFQLIIPNLYEYKWCRSWHWQFIWVHFDTIKEILSKLPWTISLGGSSLCIKKYSSRPLWTNFTFHEIILML